MIVELETADTRSDPSDYWDEYETAVWEIVAHLEEKSYLTRAESPCEVMEDADATSFIVTYDPSSFVHHDDADAVVRVYDGYVE